MIERLLQIIDYKGINKSIFYKETGLSNGFLDKVKDIGVSKLELILKAYPDIDMRWLITGEGSMIKNNDKIRLSDDTDIIKRILYIRDNFFEGNNSKFASFIGTSEANIRNYCKSIVPRTEFLIALADKLEINFDWLMLGKGQIKNVPTSKDNFDLNNCDYLKYIVELQKEIIHTQKNEIESLKKELNISSKK